MTEHLNGFKIAMLPDVREHCEGFPVELWLRSGRLVVRCSNECGNNYTDLDLGDLLDWAGSGDLRYLQEEKNVAAQSINAVGADAFGCMPKNHINDLLIKKVRFHDSASERG